LQAFLWLRWRLRVNQLKKGGSLNAVLLAILAVVALILAVVLCVTFFLVGVFAFRTSEPWVLLITWDVLVAVFLMFWMVGLLTELQRSEVLSLDRFLHLPVSLTGAFLINYLSSLLSLNLIVFVPAMFGLAVGLIFGRRQGALVVSLPLLAAFLFAVTALTFQFQGWLASLMVNKRRRRTVIVVVTAVFILIVQVPNLVNVFRPWKGPQPDQAAAHHAAQMAQLRSALEAGRISLADYQRQSDEIKAQAEEAKRQEWQKFEPSVRLINAVLPPGWLALGAMAAADGQVWPGLLGTLGLVLIGSASLWRAYRTTVRLYTGQFTASGKRHAAAPAPAASTGKPRANFLERELPRLSEQTQAIALCGLRSLLRAPEAKMMMLTTLILVVVFGGVMLRRPMELPEAVRPMLVFGAMAMLLLSWVQLMGNQFGFDRGGFRVFVLCPARRRDILLGKNLAFALPALGLGLVMAVVLEVVYPMRIDYFLAALPQLLSMYLLFCVMGNWLSILVPMPIAPGSLKPANTKLVPALFQVAVVFVFPLVMAPVLLPLGIEVGLEWLGWLKGVPVCLALSLVECLAIVYLYRLALNWQGRLLQARERKILRVVASKAE
jgi:hypothetical protein